MLHAFGSKDTYQALALLNHLRNQGVDSMDEAVRIIAGHAESISRPGARDVPARKAILAPCPECGGPLIPVVNPERLAIVGCRACRYSRIVEAV